MLNYFLPIVKQNSYKQIKKDSLKMLIKNGKHLDLKFQYELNHRTPHYGNI